MAYHKILVALSVLVTVAICQEYNQNQNQHNQMQNQNQQQYNGNQNQQQTNGNQENRQEAAASQQYASGPAMMQGHYQAQATGYGHGGSSSYENYGPDNAQYYYMVDNYDPYTYKNAHLNFNRYPGGAAYQLNEQGKGSSVNVNVETSRAKNGGGGGYGGGNNNNQVY